MFGDTMKRLRKRAGISQVAIARSLHVSPQAVSKWENNKSTPAPDAVADLAELLGVSTDELLDSIPKETADKPMSIPVLGSIPAGVPMDAIEDIVDWEDIPREWSHGGREYFALKVDGDSMWPEYLPGDTIIVRKQSVFDNGDDCVVYINGFNATLKRLYLDPDGSIRIVPINQSYPPRTYTAEEVATMPICCAGVVVELRRTKKK